MKKSFITAAIAVSALFITSCEKQSGWSISGEIAGADDRTLVIEGFNNGMWYVVDSVKTSNGEFKYNASIIPRLCAWVWTDSMFTSPLTR